MKPSAVTLIIHIYRWLLRLYPAAFLDEFGCEMEIVFAEALAEASEKSVWTLITLLLRELRDYPLSLLREGRRNRQNHRAAGQSRALAFEGDRVALEGGAGGDAQYRGHGRLVGRGVDLE